MNAPSVEKVVMEHRKNITEGMNPCIAGAKAAVALSEELDDYKLFMMGLMRDGIKENNDLS